MSAEFKPPLNQQSETHQDPQVTERPQAIADTLRSKLGRIAGVGILLAGCTVGVFTAEEAISPSIAAADTPQVTIGMPFGGKWAYDVKVDPPYTDMNSSHPSVHASYGFDWATDIYAYKGTDVTVNGTSPSGTVTFQRNSTSDTCSSYGANIAGHGETLNVLVNGVKVGEVKYDHLDLVDVGSSQIASGTKIGTVTSESLNSSCYQNRHVHVQFRNAQGNYACYVDHGTPGVDTLTEGTPLGVLGSTNGGAKQACTSVPTEIRPQTTIAIPWNFETMEGDAGSMSTFDADTGKTPATAIFNNQLYAFSYEASGGNLRLAKTAPGWQFSTLDGLGGTNGRRNEDVGQTPAATAYGSSLQVFDYDSTGGNLRHGWSADGANWNFEDLDGTPGSILGHDANVGQTPTVVSHSDGSLQLLYFDATNKNLRHAWASSTGWHSEVLDGDPNSILGQDTDTGYDPTMVSFNGTLQALYYDRTNGNLRHAWSDSTGWHAETLDGDPNSICGLDSNLGTNPALVVHNNTLQAFYYDEGNKNLRHAWSDSTGWHCETLDGDSNSVLGNNEDLGGMPTAVSMGPTSLNVFAKDMKWGGLRHYWTDSTGWHSEYFDGYGGDPAGRVNYSVGDDPVATNYNGSLQLFYYDNTVGNLRHSIPNK